MKKFLITEEKITLLLQSFERLGLVEVRGDSVEQLFGARLGIKQVIESVKEMKNADIDETILIEKELSEEKKEGD